MASKTDSILYAQIADMAAEYGLDSNCVEELSNYAEQVAATAVTNLLDEAKSSGNLASIKSGKGTFADLFGVSGGAAAPISAASKARAAQAAPETLEFGGWVTEAARRARAVIEDYSGFGTFDVNGVDCDTAKAAKKAGADVTTGCTNGVLGHNVD